jgi:hypothetical protein
MKTKKSFISKSSLASLTLLFRYSEDNKNRILTCLKGFNFPFSSFYLMKGEATIKIELVANNKEIFSIDSGNIPSFQTDKFQLKQQEFYLDIQKIIRIEY